MKLVERYFDILTLLLKLMIGLHVLVFLLLARQQLESLAREVIQETRIFHWHSCFSFFL